MAATTATAIKHVIETAGLGLTAQRDTGDDMTLPYAVIHEAISVVDSGGMRGNEGDRWIAEEVDVYIYQALADETYGLNDAVMKRLADATTYPPVLTNEIHEVNVTSGSRRPPKNGDTSVAFIIPVVVKRGI